LNIETDVLSKYAAQQLAAMAATPETIAEESVAAEDSRKATTDWLTAEYLLQNGY
jgi:hypothetical protein